MRDTLAFVPRLLQCPTCFIVFCTGCVTEGCFCWACCCESNAAFQKLDADMTCAFILRIIQLLENSSIKNVRAVVRLKHCHLELTKKSLSHLTLPLRFWQFKYLAVLQRLSLNLQKSFLWHSCHPPICT